MQNKQDMVDGINSPYIDLDLLDEQARKNLGYGGKKEIIIYQDLNQNQNQNQNQNNNESKN